MALPNVYPTACARSVFQSCSTLTTCDAFINRVQLSIMMAMHGCNDEPWVTSSSYYWHWHNNYSPGHCIFHGIKKWHKNETSSSSAGLLHLRLSSFTCRVIRCSVPGLSSQWRNKPGSWLCHMSGISDYANLRFIRDNADQLQSDSASRYISESVACKTRRCL